MGLNSSFIAYMRRTAAASSRDIRVKFQAKTHGRSSGTIVTNHETHTHRITRSVAVASNRQSERRRRSEARQDIYSGRGPQTGQVQNPKNYCEMAVQIGNLRVLDLSRFRFCPVSGFCPIWVFLAQPNFISGLTAASFAELLSGIPLLGESKGDRHGTDTNSLRNGHFRGPAGRA
jgi:hypothetical protein